MVRRHVLYLGEINSSQAETWRKAVEVEPDYWEALCNLGLASAEAGSKGEARQALERFVAKAPPSRFGADLVKARNLLRELGG